MGGMLNFLRRARTEPVDHAARAATFWRRWRELLPEVSSALGEGLPHRVEPLIAEALAEVHPGLEFSLERGNDAVYALVVSARGDPQLRPCTDAWMAAAPAPDATWEYHDAVPAVPDPAQVTLNLRGQSYALAQMRVAARIDRGRGLVDVEVFHPGFAGLDEAATAALTFMPLDAALGERLAADRIGRVDTVAEPPAQAVGLGEFRDLVRDLDRAGAH